MRTTAPALLVLVAGCSYSLEGDLEGARAEIRELQRSIPPEAPMWIHEGPDAFGQFTRDYDDSVPDFIYHHVLRKLHEMTAEEVDGASEGPFDPEACAKDPDAFRGRIWQVQGMVADLAAEPVPASARSVSRAHAAVIFDRRLRPQFVHVSEKPEVLRLREDEAGSHAVFVQWIEYVSRSGRRVTAPFFVGRNLRRIL